MSDKSTWLVGSAGVALLKKETVVAMTKLETSLMHVVAQLVEKIDLLTKESDELKKRPTEGEFSYYKTEAERLRDENKRLRGEFELIRQEASKSNAQVGSYAVYVPPGQRRIFKTKKVKIKK